MIVTVMAAVLNRICDASRFYFCALNGQFIAILASDWLMYIVHSVLMLV